MLEFVKHHWTWLTGLTGAIVHYIAPSATASLAHLATAHPQYAFLTVIAAMILAHFSPAPTDRAQTSNVGN